MEELTDLYWNEHHEIFDKKLEEYCKKYKVDPILVLSELSFSSNPRVKK